MTVAVSAVISKSICAQELHRAKKLLGRIRLVFSSPVLGIK